MSNEITVIAIITAKDGLADQVKQLLLALIEPTHREPGCIDYRLHLDSDNPCRFMFYEVWQNKQALDEHIKKPYLQSLIEKADQLFAEPLNVTIWKKTG